MAGGDYGRVRHTFWSDPDVKRKLSPGQKLLLLYFFSNPHTNLCGIYHLPLEYAALETGLDLEDVRRWTAGELGRFVSYDDDTEEVFVHRLAKHQVGEDLSPRDKRAPRIRSEVEGVHSRRLSSLFADTYASWGIVPATPAPEAPSKPLGSPFEGPP